MRVTPAPSAPTSLIGAAFAPSGPGRYVAAGLVNTGAAYLVMLLAASAGAPFVLANALGFAAGLLVSFATASRYTFSDRERAGRRWAYLTAFAACYALNLTVAAAVNVAAPAWLAQGVGLATYAAAFYGACRFWVFGKRRSTA